MRIGIPSRCGRTAGLGSLMAALCAASGCQEPKVTRIELTAHDESGAAQLYATDFARAFYHRTADGMIELALQSEAPSSLDPSQTITQILYVKEFWKPRPGTTYVEASQINAHVQYALLTPPTGVRYDGSAFLTWRIDKRTGLLTGRLESGHLAPRYRMGDASAPFASSSFKGTVRATDDAAQVADTAQTLKTLFERRGRQR